MPKSTHVSHAELVNSLSMYWPDEVEIAGPSVTSTVVDSYLYNRRLIAPKGKGVSEFPVMEVATTLLALCSIITTTISIIDALRDKDRDSIEKKVKSELPAELHIHIHSIEFSNFIDDAIDNSAGDK